MIVTELYVSLAKEMSEVDLEDELYLMSPLLLGLRSIVSNNKSVLPVLEAEHVVTLTKIAE